MQTLEKYKLKLARSKTMALLQYCTTVCNNFNTYQPCYSSDSPTNNDFILVITTTYNMFKRGVPVAWQQFKKKVLIAAKRAPTQGNGHRVSLTFLGTGMIKITDRYTPL